MATSNQWRWPYSCVVLLTQSELYVHIADKQVVLSNSNDHRPLTLIHWSVKIFLFLPPPLFLLSFRQVLILFSILLLSFSFFRVLFFYFLFLVFLLFSIDHAQLLFSFLFISFLPFSFYIIPLLSLYFFISASLYLCIIKVKESCLWYVEKTTYRTCFYGFLLWEKQLLRKNFS